ncbi:MAG: hypothetical protein ABSE64_07235 [Vulcanimicrobiaceae bacterium]
MGRRAASVDVLLRTNSHPNAGRFAGRYGFDDLELPVLLKKKAAAGLTAAGLVFIAGCSGGGHAGPSGGILPSAPQSGGKKLALSFTIPRSAAYLTIPQASPSSKNRRAAQSTRPKLNLVRKPKFIGFGSLGGYILLDIYQNGQLASYQYLTMGFENANSDLFCYEAPPTYFSLSCYNLVNIYAPGGNDTFYAASYDSQYRLISLTPGFPGTSVYGTPPASVTIPYSGAVDIQTYGVPAALYIDSATPCVSPYADSFHLTDVDGDFLVGPLAYPVTINSSTFPVVYEGQSMGTSPTIYNANIELYYFSAPGEVGGQTTTVAAHTQAGTVSVNFPTMYSVDHTAFTASTSGLYATGLVTGSASSYVCGRVPLTSLYTGQALTFTNPVGISQDGTGAIVVLDDTTPNPTVDVILADGLFISPSVVPVAQTVLSSTGGDDIAASFNDQAYVVNADGTIHRVDYSLAATYLFSYDTGTDTAIAGGLTASAGSNISAVSVGTFDYVFATSYSSPNLYEVDNANTGSPVGGPFNLTGVTVSNVYADMLTSATVTTATSTDPNSLYASFRAWDGINNNNVLVTCTLYGGVPCLGNIQANAYGNQFGVAGSLATVPLVPGLFFSYGANLVGVYENNTASSFTIGSTFSPNPGRVVASPDSLFAGVQLGTSFYFAPTTTATPVGSQAGTISAIWNSAFF